MPYVTINDANIYYQSHGDEEPNRAPIVLIHGSTIDSHNDWDSTIPPLAKHYKVFAPGPQDVAGLAFWTTEIEPLERGYDGPIKILVGMDMQGMLTGIVVAQHHEPYGDFSIEPPQFAAQFKGKSVRDGFRVGADIDAVSRATISVTSAARAIRNSARRMATQLLAPPK